MVDDEEALLGDGLLEELEEWDKMFDSLHLPESSDLAQTSAVEEEFQLEGQPTDADIDVGEGATVVRDPVFATTGTAPPPFLTPDDEGDPFSMPDEDLQLDGEPRALGALLGTGRKRPTGGEEDDGLVTSAPRPPPGTARPNPTPRRSAAIVRRPGTTPKRTWAATTEARPRPSAWSEMPDLPPATGGEEGDSGGFWPEERTQAVASELVERLAESAEALFRDAPPEVKLELDEDFYEGIEVAPTSGEAAAPIVPRPDAVLPPRPRPPTAPGTGAPLAREPRLRPPTGETPASRRTSTNIVRRAPTPTGRIPTLSASAPAETRRRDSASTAPPPRLTPAEQAKEAEDLALFEKTLAGVAPFVPETEAPTREQDRPTAAALAQASARRLGAVRPRRPSTAGDDDREVEAALDSAVAIGDGTLVAPPPGLSEIDLAPDLPASPFVASEPGIDFDSLVVVDVEPSADDRTEELTRDLLLYERELNLSDEPAPTARLRLEAGRLAEQLGDLDRARMHYDTALQLDPRLRPPLRALRRVERALGNLGEVVRHLDAEIELASARERRALAAYRADLLMATGEQDVARVAVGDLVDEAPTDVRALLADLELAWVDGRSDELDATLDQLAQAVADRALAGAMARARGLLAGARGGDGDPAYRGALLVDPADRLAWMGLAHNAVMRGDVVEAAELTGHLVGQGGLGQAAPALAGALEWRRGEALVAGGQVEAAGRSIARAAELLPDDPDLAELHAGTLEVGGEMAAAARALGRAAERSQSRWHAARLLRRAAALWGAADDAEQASSALRQAAERDPSEPLAAIDLLASLEESGDHQGLAEQMRRQLDEDGEGAVLSRLRLARALEKMGQSEQALAVLAEGRALGLRSPVLDGELDRATARAGKLAERARLCRDLFDEKPAYLDPQVAQRRAAAALERQARAEGGGELPAVPSPIAAEGSAGEPVPEPFFAQVSRPIGPPDEDRAAAGVWRESAAAEPPSPRAAALAGWRGLLALEPRSTVARAGLLRMAQGMPAEDRLAILSEAQEGEPPPGMALELALRRAELLIARRAAADAGEVLAAAAQLDGDDPRPTVALLRLAAADQRWADAAALLADRADSLEGDQAIAYRFRAAGILLDHAHAEGADGSKEAEASERRAADLLTSVTHARPEFLVAAELLRGAQRRLGESPPIEAAAPPTPGERREQDDDFSRLLREAETVELQLADAGRAASLYQRALQLRPDDPLARDGFARNAERAGEAAPLAELALADLRQAEAMGDGQARAAAYEELARIDADLRGDLASAILGWSSAVEADPERMTAVRALERAFLTAGADREADLYQLYGRLFDHLGGARESAALLAEMARLAERTGRPRDELLGHFRRLRALEPSNRIALFRLEAQARLDGPSRDLAELEQAVARSFAGDTRAEAAFNTRAGETLTLLGDRRGAVASFRAAVAALPGYAPALTGWRDAAVAGGMWLDVAEAAEREANATESDTQRAALHHLAGVALMDRAHEEERAIGVLRQVLDADPAHTDAFFRLKQLYEETGQEVELVELYHQRLAVESDAELRMALHQGLARLYRNFFDDREGARRHLKSALEIEPDNLRAIADLSDISWELGDWAEAAEALIARAKLETRPEVLRHIFYRLGTIYADRLPDPRYAMMSFQKVLTYDPRDTAALAQVSDLAARSGDHRLALGACEQLIKLAASDADKVVHLHRVARIYLDGLGDRQKAERAYRIALDMDPTSEDALMALVGFYNEVGDSISARVHLDRVAGAMRQRQAGEPSLLQPYQVLARALAAREQAGVAGSSATAHCAAEIAVLLGSTDERDTELAAGAKASRAPLAALASSDIDDLLFPPAVSSSLRALFRLLGDRIAKQLGLDVRRYGVGRAERLRPGADPLAGAIGEMAAEMGIHELEVYVSQRQPTVLAVEPTNPPSLVIGAQVGSLDRPAELRFLVARALKLARCSLAVPARMGVDELGALVAGMLRQFAPEYTPNGLDPAQVSAEQQKLRRLIPSNMLQELAPFAIDIAGAGFDHRAVWAGVIDGGNRAGLLAAGSAAAAIGSVLRLGGYRNIHQGVRDPFVIGLMQFAVSEDHASLRAQLDA